MTTDRRRARRLVIAALGVAAGLFTFHTAVLFELANNSGEIGRMIRAVGGDHAAGILVVLAFFFCLFIAHFAEAAAWGGFLVRKGLMPTFSEGVYFAASSITALGYGDVVLAPPARIVGPIIAINGLLMFGCSTAFLFLTMQSIWLQTG